MNRLKQVLFLSCGMYWAFTFISCKSDTRETLFSKLPESKTQINFENIIEENDSINILEFLSAYNGAGIGGGDFNNDGLIDLYFVSNQQANKLYMNRGDFKFEDVTNRANVEGLNGINTWSNGVTLIDINGDGWLDIYVCMMHGYLGLEGVNQLFINEGDGTFRESAGEYGLDFSSYAQHAAFFDYDKDGDPDMYLLNQAVHTKESFKPADTRHFRDSLAGDRLLENVNGKFVDVSEQAGIFGGAMGYGLAVSTADINNDGWLDIYVSNDFHENDYLYYNQHDGTFKENIKGSIGHLSKSSMGNDLGDYDNDGDIDIITLDMKPSEEVIAKQTTGIDPYPVYKYKLKVGYHFQHSRNMLQQNLGPLFLDKEVQFSEIGQLIGVSETDWSWSVLMVDLDNDGLKDLFVTNGIPNRPNSLDYRKFVNSNTERAEATPSLELISLMPEGKAANIVYRNIGDRYKCVSSAWGLDWNGFSNGAICVDLDNDGDQDIILNNLNSRAHIYRNQTSEETGKQYLKVSLLKNGNRHIGSGARVMVSSKDMDQIQELKSTSGWLSSYVGGLVFGFDAAIEQVEVKVTWSDDKVQIINVGQLNTDLEIKYEDAQFSNLDETSKFETTFKNISDLSGIEFTHRENKYIDFSIEPLIPHFLSTQGPKLAIGDINGDDIDDFFIGGSKQQPGKIFLGRQSNQSFFREGNSSVFEGHKHGEDVGAEFADIDNDGDLDLYVVSGSGEPEKSYGIQDRLYINDGTGNFTYKSDALPDIRYNGSCVVAIDVNSDGFQDLFVGGRSTPTEYGLGGFSKLLVNDGRGHFKDETEKYLGNNGRIGMVTDAAWISQTSELVVVGEWMSIGIFKFSSEKSEYTEIPNSSGWWNSLLLNDLDNDGDMDFLVGNAGLNTELLASPEHPIDLYVKDFDGNLSLDPIIAYYKNGKKWVYPGLDELTNQMPAISQIFRVYRNFAYKSFDEIFPAEQIEKSIHAQVQILASVVVEKTSDGYKMNELPLMSQAAPIFGFTVDDFNDDGLKDILAIGNLYDNQPSIGKLDASYGIYLKGKGDFKFEYIEPLISGFIVGGEARDIKILTASDKSKLILISRNNSSVCLYK